ncbi:serine hydrolase domain-containing protein [Chitinophaga sp. 212800010-3]|uniref:serine hydrolase domain-containing protein n=1 Tax=unclassified Chitinophaga TaxID=2619133 RepID=UPI002DF31EB9|nr:Serine hydrolase [Chitinophaga sp. 212800010-3]
MRYLSLTIVICFYCIASTAQEVREKLDSLFESIYKDHAFNGNVLVVEKGKEIYRREFGYANVEDHQLNKADTRFQLASVSKTFTATAILQLKEKNKLKLDDPVQQYLPDFPLTGVTIRQLLQHTSGLQDYQIFEKPHREDTGRIFTNADIIPALKRYEMVLPPPGERWSYSNIGYGLLVLIIEECSGMSYPAYMERYIFRAAGMTHTYLASALLRHPDPERSVNYDFYGYAPADLLRVDSLPRYRIPNTILGGILGPGYVVSTTDDLLRFDEALYGNRLLRQETLEEAWTPGTLNNGQKAAMGWGSGQSYYGLGWNILRDTSIGKVVWHSGGAPGIVTVFLRNISRRQTVIVLDNVTHRNVHGNGINAMYLLNHRPPFPEKRSLASVYAQTLVSGGPDLATAQFNTLKRDTAHYYLDERELNTQGLELLWNGYPALGLEALKLNTLLFPGSWNVYDSYAAALVINNRKDAAIAMYRLSVTMNPGNNEGRTALQKLLEQMPQNKSR